MAETTANPFHESDYAEVQPHQQPGRYLVIAYGPDLHRMTVHETRDLAEANAFAARLHGLMEAWHRDVGAVNR